MNVLFKATSYHTGAAWAVAATFVWKLISFANALLIAAWFGATYKTDIYFYLIMLVGFGVAFMQRLNSTVLIPESIFLHEQNPAQARQFLINWFYFYVLCAVILTVTGFCWPASIGQLFSRFDAAYLQTQTVLISSCFLLFGLQLLTYYLQAVAEAYRYFATAWLGILNALCPLVCLILWGKQLGLVSMVYGFLIANIIQIIVFLWICKKLLQWNFIPRFFSFSARMWHNTAAGQTLAVLDSINSLLPVYLISGLGAGLLSALNYCRQLTDSPTEILTARVATISKLELAADFSKQTTYFNAHFLKATHFLLILLVPLTVFSCWFAPEIVSVFFKRGVFSTVDAHHTVLFLRPMLFTLLLLALGYVQNSAIAATRTVKESFIYALSSGLFLTVAVWFVLPRWGAFSYPYVLSAGLLFGFILNYFFFKKYIPFADYPNHLKQALFLLGKGIAALIIPAGISRLLGPNAWIQIFVCGTIYVLLYVLILSKSGDWEKLKRLTK